MAAGEKNTFFKDVLKAAENAFKHLHSKGSYKAGDITEEPYQKLIDETYKVFNSAIKDNDIPLEMMSALQSDAFLFGGLKTHAQLLEANSLLTKDGRVKSYRELEHEFTKLNVEYNQNYLEAEYQFAVNSAQMAANWAALDEDGRYNLQYRTASDDRVRPEHAELEGITLPKEDDFWLEYYPPNGWNCRCTVVEVRKSKYEESDSAKALESGEKATTKIGKDGKNRLEIFRFNPGKEEKLFPPKHPYYPRGCGGNNISDLIGAPAIFLAANDDKCKVKNILESEYKKVKKSALDTRREKYVEVMKPLQKRSVSKNVSPNKTISIKFTTKGNKHIANDILTNTSGLKKGDLPKLHEYLKEAEYLYSSGLTHPRTDNIVRFYYFKDKEKNIYYNVAESVESRKNGQINIKRFLYSVTNDIDGK